MPTTTSITKFDPLLTEAGLEILKERARTFSLEPKTPLVNFLAARGITLATDNLVSETVDWDAWTRTVVRSWDTLELAQAWVQALNAVTPQTNYPGQIISAQVDPE